MILQPIFCVLLPLNFLWFYAEYRVDDNKLLTTDQSETNIRQNIGEIFHEMCVIHKKLFDKK